MGLEPTDLLRPHAFQACAGHRRLQPLHVVVRAEGVEPPKPRRDLVYSQLRTTDITQRSHGMVGREGVEPSRFRTQV